MTFLHYSLALLLLLPLTSFAQGFVPLAGIPFLEGAEPASLSDYANALYIAAISLGAVVAVVKIIIAGIKYMLTDVVTDKSSAKADIKGALLGLILMVAAVLILNTINPEITNITALDLTRIGVEMAAPQGRTEADQCPTGQSYINTPAYPNGACVETNAGPIGGEDYTNNPDEGNVRCIGNGTYNPETNRCEQITPIGEVPGAVLDTFEIEAGCVNGEGCNMTILTQRMNQWCVDAYGTGAFDGGAGTVNFDRVNQSCVVRQALD